MFIDPEMGLKGKKTCVDYLEVQHIGCENERIVTTQGPAETDLLDRGRLNNAIRDGALDPERDDDVPLEFATHTSTLAKTFLIVLLATRGITKEVRENNRAKLGIGKKRNRRYETITTISIGQTFNRDGTASSGNGSTKRPHLRRGHIRRQHYGHGMTLEKRIFIEPCFVNGDDNYSVGALGEREAYKVRV